ncbi:MAG: hypothetical protein AAFN74_07470 [Myxococcota bacterium]
MIGLPRSASQIAANPTTIPQRIHPLAQEGYRRYFKNSKKRFDKEDVEALRSGMLELASDPQAMWGAISGLGLLAVLLEQEGDNDNGAVIRQLISSGGQHLAPIAGMVAEALGIESPQGVAERNRRVAEALTSAPVQRRAALHDAPRPQGSLPLFLVDFAMVSSRFKEVRLPQGPAWRATFRNVA